MSSIKKFQRNRDREIEEDDLITAEGYASTIGPDMAPLDPAKQWKINVRQLIADYIKNPQGLYNIAKQRGPNSPEAFAYNQIIHPTSKIPLPPDAVTFEGWQDFNKVEPYAVCLAGKPVKKFDYYEEARRFHDNWKQKLYREGNKEKADKITLMPIMDEASMSWAANKSTGPKFGGYLKGTDPAPTEFSKKSVGGMEEGIDGNMTVRSNPLSQPLRKRNYVAKNAQSSGAGKHNNNLKAAAARGQVKHKAKAFELDEMTNDDIAKLRADADARIKQDIDKQSNARIAAIKNPPKEKSFMQQVGDKQIGMVKGAWKGLIGQVEEDDMEEGWKNTVAGAALAGAAALGAGGAHAGGVSTTGQGFSMDDQLALNQQMQQRVQQQYDQAQHQQKPQAPTAQKDLSAFGTEYLQKVADGQGGRAMVSVADAKAELAARANGTSQQAPAPVKAPAQNNGQYKSLGDYYKANPGVRESSDNFLSWAVRNGYNFTKDPAIYESAKKEYKALVESKKKTLSEAKGLGKKVRVVSGPAAGQTGTIGEVRNGAYQGAPKYYTVDLDNGGHVQVRKEALKLIKDDLEESLKDGEYFIWTVYFDNGTSKRIKVKSDEFDPYAYYARQNQVVVNVDYNWEIHQ